MDLTPLTSLLPAQITLGSALKFIAIFAAVAIVASLIIRLLFGRNSAFNKAVCAGIGVLCVYVLTVIVYTFSPGNLEQYLVPLPFVKFSGEYMYVMAFPDAALPAICTEIMSMVILVFLYNLTDAILPDGETPVTWFVLRGLTIVAAMVVHYFITTMTNDFLPELLVSYGPTIFLVCLIVSLLTGIIGVLLGLIVTVINPIFGLLFSFFFSGKIGKQISKAMLTTLLLTALVAVLGHFGYSIISISITSLLSYIPMLVILVALWFLIGRKF